MEQNQFVAFSGGLLIDGTGSEPIPNSVLIVQGRQIRAVGKKDEIVIPSDCRVVDISGKSIMPGMFDCHCHFTEITQDFTTKLFTHKTVKIFQTAAVLRRLLQAIKEDPHPIAGKFLLIALYTGLRRMEIAKLEWTDIDFERSLIKVRNPKGGQDATLPLNESAKAVFESIPETDDSTFVFPGRAGHVYSIYKMISSIRDKAGLPENFRPLHGMRHTYASLLASSGKVDLFTIQKLLNQKSPGVTQRYAHLRDESLRRASSLAGELVAQAVKEEKKADVVNLDEKRG